MIRTQYIEHLLAILCYDSIVNVLSIADRYWLFREIAANQTNVTEPAIQRDASTSILGISEYIRDTKWQRPELKYNSDRVLQVYEDFNWKNFKPEKYV